LTNKKYFVDKYVHLENEDNCICCQKWQIFL